jgi:hypothetical protein
MVQVVERLPSTREALSSRKRNKARGLVWRLTPAILATWEVGLRFEASAGKKVGKTPSQPVKR